MTREEKVVELIHTVHFARGHTGVTKNSRLLSQSIMSHHAFN